MPSARCTSLRAVAIIAALVSIGGTPFASAAEEPDQPLPGVESKLPKGLNVEFEGLTRTEDGNYEFTGPVIVHWRDSKIQADRIILLQERYVEAEGNVLIVWAGNHVFGERMTYDLETEQGIIENAFGQVMADYIFWAKRVEKIGTDRLHLESAHVTTCTQPVPYWSFSVSSATIRVDHYAKMWNVRLRARKLPLIYLPYLVWPVKEDRAVGLLMPEFHTTENRGHAISQELFIPLGRSADLTLLGRYYTEAGFGGGGELRFVPNSRGTAALNGFFINDQVAGEGRYRAAYGQTQQFRNGFRMVADINLVSDFEYYTDFERELDLITSPTILTRLEFARNGPWTSLNVRELRREQLFTGLSSKVQQTLPEIEWRGRSRRLGKSPVYLSYESSVASIQQREELADGTPVLDADYIRGDVFPVITMPLSPAPWLEITPVVQYRYSYYSQHQSATDRTIIDSSITRGLFGAGLEIVGPKVFRLFERPHGSYSKRYKHAIEPRISYGYGEAFDRKDEIILFDEVDRVSGTGNQINFALVQRLFAQRPRTALQPAPAEVEPIVLPDGSLSDAGTAEAERKAAGAASSASTSRQEPPQEPVEIATLEFRQSRSFDSDLSAADLDGDGEKETTSPYGDIQVIGRFNPSAMSSIDLRGGYDILHDALRDVTLSGNLRRKLARLRFSIVHRNGLEVNQTDDTQLRLTTGFSLFRGKLQLDLDGSFDYDPPEGLKHVPDKRWRIQYGTQCCTFLFEQLTRDFAAGTDRRDFYFRVDLKGIGKILDLNY